MILNRSRGSDMKVVHVPDGAYHANRSKSPFTVERYHEVRNLIYAVCKNYGTVGPMGPLPLVTGAGFNRVERFWPIGDKPCQFFVLDDCYSLDEKFIRVEVIKFELLTPEWVENCSDALSLIDGWAVAVCNLTPGSILSIFAGSVRLTGEVFAGANELTDVVARARQRLFS
jgi:hypothetical protein